VLVLPDGLDVLLEEVDVGPHLHLGGSFEVLVECPELLDGGDVGHGVQTVFETVALRELLIPELQRVKQGQRLIGLLHNI
jgi:hypothetical protein